ncbi:NAD(P)-binding protein [Arcobacter roscoffensis]|uniref:NAD(P)-binding protein n=1 Tax=Arcobacter roscoffensis TaxID=2961520 RepID=A0ABY5E5C0_9BACT|nr:NAD(P)-binding protein [Arcobacter roscoffensis]UTJ06370.1 NAD(P)-binding protein [Arcobacter roscoffensis]
MKENIVIVGGGIAGLLSASLLAEDKKYNIHLIEKTNSLGGLLKCFDYGKNGKFDYGAHNILETGINELDNILRDLLPSNEWQVSSAINGQKRALTGIYFDGKLQQNSPFIDLRKRKNIDELRIDFLKNFEKTKEHKKTTAYEYSKSLFGKKITKEAVVPVFKSLYGIHPKHMDYMAMFLTPLVRVGLFDEKIMKDLLPTQLLSSILSYPEQKNLGSDILGVKKAYYPKKYGIYRVIEALKEQLEKQGVNIHLEDEVKDIVEKNNRIEEIILSNTKIKNINHLFWSAGHLILKNLLKIKLDNLKFQKPPKTVITNLLIDKKLKIGDICYFYNYDSEYKTFRVDNYINYCSGAKRNGLYPISIETLASDNDLENIDKITQTAIDELKAFNVFGKACKVKFAKTEVLDYGFPLLTKDNIETMDRVRESILNRNIKNLTLLGILSQKDLFFESDIKKDLYLKVKRFLDEC